METKEPLSGDRFFNNTLLLIDVRTRLNPTNQDIVSAVTVEQGQHVARLIRRAFLQLNLQVHLDFTNVIPINSQFFKGLLGDLVETDAGNHLLCRIKFRGCGTMIHSMWASVIDHQRNENMKICRISPQSR